MPSRDIDKLHPIVADKCRRFLQRCEARGLHVIVTQTDRTRAEHRAFCAQGREPLDLVNTKREVAGLPPITKVQNRRITWVEFSVHEFGFGFDVCIVKDGRAEWDTKADINANGDPDYEEIGRIGELLGLVWGGRFKGRDLVHFEWTGGLTIEDLKAGKVPYLPKKKPIKKQEDKKMTTPTLIALARGLFMLNTTKKYEVATGKERPMALSRRVIHMTLAAGSMLVATLLGIQIPEADVASLGAAIGAVVDTFEQNKALIVTLFSSLGTCVGHFKRKK